MNNDSYYNASTRALEVEVDIYFTAVPLTVKQDSYLMGISFLEELGSSSETNPIGDPSSNELNLTLYNDKGLFSPSNSSSPYYGLMKAGLKVVARIKPIKSSLWDTLGTYYVSEWIASITGLQSEVTCYDKMVNAFAATPKRIEVIKDATYVDAFKYLANAIELDAVVDDSIRGSLSWWYVSGGVQNTFTLMSSASMSSIIIDRDNKLNVSNYTNPREIRAVLTDADQILSAEIPRSISNSFDGLVMFTNNTQLTITKQLLTIPNYLIDTSQAGNKAILFTATPVVLVEDVMVSTTLDDKLNVDYSYSADSISIDATNNAVAKKEGSLIVNGKSIEAVKEAYTSSGVTPLSFDNLYAQTDAQMLLIKLMLDKFVAESLPSVSVKVRGNPGLHIGDKITVKSAKYNLDFTGIIQRADYTYTGYLSATLVLINSKMLEVST